MCVSFPFWRPRLNEKFWLIKINDGITSKRTHNRTACTHRDLKNFTFIIIKCRKLSAERPFLENTFDVLVKQPSFATTTGYDCRESPLTLRLVCAYRAEQSQHWRMLCMLSYTHTRRRTRNFLFVCSRDCLVDDDYTYAQFTYWKRVRLHVNRLPRFTHSLPLLRWSCLCVYAFGVVYLC